MAAASDKSGNVNLNTKTQTAMKAFRSELCGREKYTKTLPKQCVCLPRDSIFRCKTGCVSKSKSDFERTHTLCALLNSDCSTVCTDSGLNVLAPGLWRVIRCVTRLDNSTGFFETQWILCNPESEATRFFEIHSKCLCISDDSFIGYRERPLNRRISSKENFQRL